MNELIENMICWAKDQLGSGDYAGWCLSFIEDALEKSNGIDDYLKIEVMTTLSGNHPKYIGWVPVERVVKQRREL